MKEVLPVLFSPTRRVSGARRAVCSSRKQRKFRSVISSITGGLIAGGHAPGQWYQRGEDAGVTTVPSATRLLRADTAMGQAPRRQLRTYARFLRDGATTERNCRTLWNRSRRHANSTRRGALYSGNLGTQAAASSAPGILETASLESHSHGCEPVLAMVRCFGPASDRLPATLETNFLSRRRPGVRAEGLPTSRRCPRSRCSFRRTTPRDRRHARC